MVIYFVSLVGAWRGRNWARGWFTFSVAAFLLYLDIQVLHAVESLLTEAWNILNGMLIMALWTQRPSNQQGSPEIAPQAPDHR